VAVPVVRKAAVRRPGANEGGREEERKRPGIAASQAGSPHNSETVITQPQPLVADVAVTLPPNESSEASAIQAQAAVTQYDTDQPRTGPGLPDPLAAVAVPVPAIAAMTGRVR
jgi:hypothetical protein